MEINYPLVDSEKRSLLVDSEKAAQVVYTFSTSVF